jgi:Family of unknown function (DUF5999)
MINTPIDSEANHPVAAHDCRHTPCCPGADASDRDAAHVVSARPEQGWSLLCNGVVVFEDFGELLPNGQSIDSRRVDLLAVSPHRRSA